MQQNKITILCTRPVDEELVADAVSKGIDIDVVPFIRTESILSVEIQQEIEQVSLLMSTVVFTSMNAVDAVTTVLEDYKPNWKIYCIGYATGELVKTYFEEDQIAGSADSAAELAEIIINDDNDEVFFFCGDQRRDELPGILRKQNVEVNEIEVYQTIAIPQKLDKAYNGILFFSPSAAASFFTRNKLDKKTILFAIGNTTANEIKKYLPAAGADSPNEIVISDRPGKKDLLEKAISYFDGGSVQN
jgi:uroporphyrinogen-III synthase